MILCVAVILMGVIYLIWFVKDNEIDSISEIEIDSKVLTSMINYTETLTDDGDHIRTIYAIPQSYQEGSTFKKINNIITEGGNGYSNITNVYKTFFDINDIEESIMRLEIPGDRNLTVSIENTQTSEVIVDSSVITFEEVLPGIDMQYEILPAAVMQSFVINKDIAEFPLNIKLMTSGIIGQLQDDKSIFFVSDDSEKERLINLEKILSKKIIGQDETLKIVSDFIRRSRVGLADPNRPIASFIFLGPSGVGKTETAKVLAKTIFEDEKALIRIDMSEFVESFNVSKLIGAPAGYVGYKEGNKLTEPVRRRPYSVVLFDEIEKAHPEVFNLLLQILEDGHLTDASGRQINFKNTIIIMTSNIGMESLNKTASMGFRAKTKEDQESAKEQFDKMRTKVLNDLKQSFRPELLNRLDKIIVFKPLNEEDIEKIVSLEIKGLEKKLSAQDLKIKINNSAIKLISQKSFTPDQGARAIRKFVQEMIENEIAKTLLKNKFKPGDTIKVIAKNDKIVLK